MPAPVTPTPIINDVIPPSPAPDPAAKISFKPAIIVGVVGIIATLIFALFAYKLARQGVNRQISGSEGIESAQVLLDSSSIGKLEVAPTETIDVNGLLSANAGFILQPSTRPDNPVRGQFYYDDATNTCYYYNGSEFVPLSGDKISELLAEGNTTELTQLFTDIFNRIDSEEITNIIGGGDTGGETGGDTGGTVDLNFPFLTGTNVAGLQSERALTAGSNIKIEDFGPNGVLVVSLADELNFAKVNTPIVDGGGQTLNLISDVGINLNVGEQTYLSIDNTGNVRLHAYNCSAGLNGGSLTTTSNGTLVCDDDAGTVGGPISGTGTTGRVPVWTTSSTLGDSQLQDNTTNLTSLVRFVVQQGQLDLGQAGSAAGSIKLFNASNGFSTTLQSNSSQAANLTFTLPSTGGNNGDCLTSTGGGALAFNSCSAGSVTSINGQTGAITFQGTGNEVEVDNSGGTFTLGIDDDLVVANTLAVDTNTLSVNGAIDAVGIGISPSASYKLLVGGSLRANGDVVVANAGSSTGSLRYSASATTSHVITLPEATGTVCLTTGNCSAGVGAAPSNSNFIAFSADANLSNERVLQGTTGNITLANNGTNVTIDLGSSPTVSSLQLNNSAAIATLRYAPLAGSAATFTLPDTAGVNDTICLLTLNNCVNASGVTTAGGSTNQIAKFTASGEIGNSSISDNGTTVTLGSGVNLLSSGNVTFDTNTLFLNASSNQVALGGLSANELLTLNGRVSLQETTAPTATGNFGKVYVKASDSKLYFMDDGGTEYDLTAGALGGDPFVQGGNGFGTTATLGTTDGQALSIITGNTSRLTVGATGAISASSSLAGDLFTISNTSSSNGADGLAINTTSTNNATQPLNVQSNALVVTGAGRVGIGVAAPGSSVFEVSGSVSGVSAIFSGKVQGADGASGSDYVTYQQLDDLVSSGSGGPFGNVFTNGGNQFGTTTKLGTTDSQDLILIAGGFLQEVMRIMTDGGLQMVGKATGSAPSVSGASTAKLYYNTTDNRLKVSLNAAAYDNICMQTLANCTGATSAGIAGAIQFSGGSGSFSADASNFFFDDSTNRLGLGTSTTTNANLTVNGGASASSLLLQNTATGTGSTDGLAVSIDNSGVGMIKNFENAALQFATNNTVRGQFTGDGSLLLSGLASAPAVSTSGNGSLFYNSTTNRFQTSANGGAYDNVCLETLANCGGGASSSGATGSVQFSDGSGGFSADASNFFWDDTNNRLGVGTATPTATIDAVFTGSQASGSVVKGSQTGSITSNIEQTGNVLNVSRSITSDISSGSAVSRGNTSGIEYSGETTQSVSHTIANNSSRVLIVTFATCCNSISSVPSTVTYAGQAMTQIANQRIHTDSSFEQRVLIYKLVDPPVGTANITSTFGDGPFGHMGGIDYYNVAASSTVTTNNGSSGTATVSATTTTADQLVAVMAVESSFPTVNGTGQTQFFAYNEGIHSGSSSYQTGQSGTTTSSWTMSSEQWGTAAVVMAGTSNNLTVSGAVASISSNCVAGAGGCLDSAVTLNVDQQNTGSTGTVVKIQNAGSGNSLVVDSTALVITGSGNVGIGDAAPADLLDVNGDIRVGTGTTGCVKDSDGTVIAGSCSSDLRLKTNINNLGSILDKFGKLRTVTFNWRSSEYPEYSFGNQLQTGFIAQEVQELFPGLVSVDQRGNLTLDYTTLSILNTAASVEMKQELDELKNELEQMINQDAKLTNLNVSGNTLIEGKLVVIGDTTFKGRLTVEGDIMVKRHLLGNTDTRGSITVEPGKTEATYQFANPYNEAPNVIVAPVNGFAPRYRIETTREGFKIYLEDAPGEALSFNYQVQG